LIPRDAATADPELAARFGAEIAAQPAATAELAGMAGLTVPELQLLMMKLELNVFDQGAVCG
jgi:hypothetical protein